MNSITTVEFWSFYRSLPKEVRQLARMSYKQWRINHHHPSLHFKKIHKAEPMYSVRIGLHYRALGLLDGDIMVWFWIGSHAEYDKFVG